MKKDKDSKISRREFLGGSAATAMAFTIVPNHVLGGPGRNAPSEKLNIAGVGVGGMGKNNIRACGTENIVALCDVDQTYAGAVYKRYPNAKQWTDFRQMLDTQKNIDAVIVATPDHSHAVVAMKAMHVGKHVYVQTPLTHNVWDARMLTRAAKKYQVATQMGNQGHSGEGIRMVCEWIWNGAIGKVREVQAWTNRPVWPQGIELDRPQDTPPVPDGLGPLAGTGTGTSLSSRLHAPYLARLVRLRHRRTRRHGLPYYGSGLLGFEVAVSDLRAGLSLDVLQQDVEEGNELGNLSSLLHRTVSVSGARRNAPG